MAVRGSLKGLAIVIFSVLSLGLLPMMAMSLPYQDLKVFNPVGMGDGLADPDVFPLDASAHPDLYYIILGDAYRKQRNYDLARDAYREALTYNATSAEAHFGLAEASFWCDDWAGAIKAFDASIRHGYRQPALAHRGMGWSYYNLDELDRAKHAFEEAIQLDPNLADAYNGLGWVLLRERRCGEAVTHFEQALALNPGFPDPQRGIRACGFSK